MAPPANLVLPFVTEDTITVGGKFVACTEASAVMAANWARPSVPVTVAEVQVLRASVPHTANGGLTQANLLLALHKRYGHYPHRCTSWVNALGNIRGGSVLTVAGDRHNLPAHLVRFYPNGAKHKGDDHEVVVGPIAAGDVSANPLVWWRDPLGRAPYCGEWVAWSTVVKFALGYGYCLGFPRGAWI